MGELISFPSPKSEQPESREELKIKIDEANLAEMASFLARQVNEQPDIHRSIYLREQTVKAVSPPFSNSDLISIVNNSSSAEWQTDPAYYIVILNEMRQRGLIKA